MDSGLFNLRHYDNSSPTHVAIDAYFNKSKNVLPHRLAASLKIELLHAKVTKSSYEGVDADTLIKFFSCLTYASCNMPPFG